MNRTKESFILFNHGCFIHDYSLKHSFTEGFRACFANSGYNNRPILKDLILKLSLMLHEYLKLSPCQHFDGLNVVTKEAYVLFIDF